MNMHQTRMTCLALVASAFVLAGLLVVQLDRKQVSLDRAANAELVVTTGTLTFLTTRTLAGEEGLFVLDSGSQKLLIYSMDLARKRLNLDHIEDLAKLF